MTGALLTTIRQRLRKRWVRCVVCLCALIVGYVASAGHVAGLAFNPAIKSTLRLDQRVQRGVLYFYKPVFLAAGSDYCPKPVARFLSFCMGQGRRNAAVELLSIARHDLGEERLRSAKSIARYVDQIHLEYDLFDDRPDLILKDVARAERRRGHQELPLPQIEETQAEEEPTLCIDLPVDWRYVRRVRPLSNVIGFHPEIEDNYDGEMAPTDSDLQTLRLAMDVGPSSRLGRSLALPGDLHWLAPSVLLTSEEIAELPSEERDEASRQCFPVRCDRSGPFISTSVIAITR